MVASQYPAACGGVFDPRGIRQIRAQAPVLGSLPAGIKFDNEWNKYNYCPPEQVVSEMDNLVDIYNKELRNAHILVKAAFLHHAFVQIHPFQDGNGRIARLLASFVLIKDGLFPLSIDRDERAKYIDSLEKADECNYQALIDVFSNNQIISIERALNWKIVDDSSNYDSLMNVLGAKLSAYRVTQEEQINRRIFLNMQAVFSIMSEELENYKNNLKESLDEAIAIGISFCSPKDTKTYYYAKQIIEYAKKFNYYVNLSLNKCWGRMLIAIDRTKRYRLVISIHHYGYDNSTFAIGAFLSKEIANSTDDSSNRTEYMDIPLGIPPLTMSSEMEISELKSSVKQQVKISVMSMLAYIANELY